MTRRNLATGFYLVNAYGIPVEWYADRDRAVQAATRRGDGPCVIERAGTILGPTQFPGPILPEPTSEPLVTLTPVTDPVLPDPIIG